MCYYSDNVSTRIRRVGLSRRRRVPAVGPGRGGAAVGPAEAEAEHELRQAVARAALLLRQEHHEQGALARISIGIIAIGNG